MVKYNDIFLVDTDSTVAKTDKVGYNLGDDVVRRIYVQAAQIKYDVGVYTQTPQQPGKPISQDHQAILAYGDNLGFSNPSITITGTIDLSTYDTDTGAGPTIAYEDDTGTHTAYIVTLKFLQQIFKCGHVFTLYDYYDYNEVTSKPDTPIYRVHSLTGIFPDETETPPKVMCTGVSIDTNTQITEGTKVTFSLKLKEVRG